MDEIIDDKTIDQDISEDTEGGTGMDFDRYSPFRVDLKRLTDSQREEFFEEISHLSEDHRRVLAGPDTVEFIIMVSEKLDLSDTQTEVLSRVVRDILLGKNALDELPALLSRGIGLEPQISQQVAGKITETIFSAERSPKPDGAPPKQTMPDNRQPSVNENNVVDLRNQS